MDGSASGSIEVGQPVGWLRRDFALTVACRFGVICQTLIIGERLGDFLRPFVLFHWSITMFHGPNNVTKIKPECFPGFDAAHVLDFGTTPLPWPGKGD